MKKFHVDIGKNSAQNGPALSFWMCKREGHFHAIPGECDIFLSLVLPWFGLFQKCWRVVFFCILNEYLTLTYVSQHPNPNLTFQSLLTSWPLMTLAWHELTKGFMRVLENIPGTIHAVSRLVFNLIWLLCPAKPAMTEYFIFDLACKAISGLQIKFHSIFKNIVPGAIK